MESKNKIYAILENKWFLPAVVLFAVAIRLALVFITYKFKTPIFADELDYLKIGTSLEQGKGFIKNGVNLTAYRPPAQPLVIALFFRLLGENYLYVKVFEALLLAIVPFICFRIGRLLGLGIAAANAGAAIAALHPALSYAASTLYPTVLTAVALTAGVWFCTIAIKTERSSSAIAAGVAFGIAGMATSTFAPMAAMAAAIMLLRKQFRLALLVGLIGTLPTIIWMARNEHAVGRFTVATNGGYNLFLGANDDATPMSGNWVDPHLYDENVIGEVALDDAYKRLAVIWIKQHPVRWGKLAIARAIVVFDSVGNPRTQGLHSGLLGHLMGWMMLPVVLLGLVGLVTCYKQPLSWLTMAALFLVVASSAATIAKPRFRFPCDPLLAEFAVVGFLSVTKRLDASERDTTENQLAA